MVIDNRYDYSRLKYVNARTKVAIICPEHGQFKQLPSAHLDSHGCDSCGRKSKTSTTEKFIQMAKKLHGDRYNYSRVKYVNCRTKVAIICPKHGKFRQRPFLHLKGSGCKKCVFRVTNTEEFIQQARKVHGDKFDYSKVEYENGQTKVTIICSKHGEFPQDPSSHIKGSGCPRCTNKAEGRIADYLNQRHIIHRCFRIEDRYFDFYLPEYNLIIERDGQQHYRHVELFSNGNKDYLAKQKVNDLYKTQLAKKYGHKIARIPYWLTPDQEEQEIANILAGNPTYPDVPDTSQRETKPFPGMFLPQPTNNYLSFVREC